MLYTYKFGGRRHISELKREDAVEAFGEALVESYERVLAEGTRHVAALGEIDVRYDDIQVEGADADEQC